MLIASSGNSDEESCRRADKAGFDQYIVKLVSLAVLAEMLAGIPVAIRAYQP